MSQLCVKDGFRADLLGRFEPGFVKCYIVPVQGVYFLGVYIRIGDPDRRIINCTLYSDRTHRGSFYSCGKKAWQWVGMNEPIDPVIQRIAAKNLQEIVGVTAHIKFTITNANRNISG